MRDKRPHWDRRPTAHSRRQTADGHSDKLPAKCRSLGASPRLLAPPPASPSNRTFEIGAPVLVLRQSEEVEDKDKGAAGSTSCGDDCSWEPAMASEPAPRGCLDRCRVLVRETGHGACGTIS